MGVASKIREIVDNSLDGKVTYSILTPPKDTVQIGPQKGTFLGAYLTAKRKQQANESKKSDDMGIEVQSNNSRTVYPINVDNYNLYRNTSNIPNILWYSPSYSFSNF